MSDESLRAYEDRRFGRAPCGEVGLRDFDRGVVETLGARVYTVNEVAGYFIPDTKVAPPPSMPGIPIFFGNPEEFENYLLPSIMVTRDDIAPAMNRYHPLSLQYRAPKPGTQPVTVTGPGGVTKTGWPKKVAKPTGIPYDISYTLQIMHERRGLAARNAGVQLLSYVMRIYQPYCVVKVVDSIGDLRLYSATAESASTADELVDITDRMTGWTLSLTVEALLDLDDEEELTTVLNRQNNFEIRRI